MTGKIGLFRRGVMSTTLGTDWISLYDCMLLIRWFIPTTCLLHWLPESNGRLDLIRSYYSLLWLTETIELCWPCAQLLTFRVTESNRRYGLDIDVNKTNLMIVSKNKFTHCTLNINQRPVERVNKCTYLGTIAVSYTHLHGIFFTSLYRSKNWIKK